jgi:hypothetical protein
MASAPACMANTRTKLLSDIWSWVASPSEPLVYWLNGLAGTGKSTISRTVCQGLSEKGILAASFFITRQRAEHRDASNIVRSIVYQLARKDAAVAQAVCTALRERPELATARPLHEQISDLLVAPAHALPPLAELCIVIDALDECFTDDRGRHGGELLSLLVRGLLKLSRRLKLFITSRTEITIQETFEDLSSSAHQKVTRLHDLDRGMVESDVRTYLTTSFAAIVASRRRLHLTDWPSSEVVEVLVERSQALFIYAATIIRFVDDRQYSPRSRLDFLLSPSIGQGSSGSPYHLLDQLYLQVLTDAVNTQGRDEDALCRRLRMVVGTIMLSLYPLTVTALAGVLDMDRDETQLVVEQLSALVLYEFDKPTRIFHPSLPDFLTSSERCIDQRFFVASSAQHHHLAHRCLVIMNRQLRFNICKLSTPSVANTDVSDLHERLHKYMTEELCYAIQCWAAHLAASTIAAPHSGLLEELLMFCNTHLLHWLEALSLTANLSSVSEGLSGAITWCKVRCAALLHVHLIIIICRPTQIIRWRLQHLFCLAMLSKQLTPMQHQSHRTRYTCITALK